MDYTTTASSLLLGFIADCAKAVPGLGINHIQVAGGHLKASNLHNQIYVNVSSETKVEIYDVNGRLLRMKNVTGFTAFDNFLAGVYMVKTISEGKVEITKVFVN